jgi:uncharacterized peroxidase-related enzyme
MTFIHTTHPNDADGSLAAMYAQQQAAWGFVPNYAKVFCHRPEVMARWGQLLAEIKRPMDRRCCELVTFAAAYELRNTYCTLAHGKALREFFSDAQIAALAEGRLAGVLTEPERTMFTFAQHVARDASAVTEEEVAALRAHGLDDGEVFDIVAVVAARAFFTKVLDALGVQADAPFAAMQESLGGGPHGGRAVDTRPVVGAAAVAPAYAG